MGGEGGTLDSSKVLFVRSRPGRPPSSVLSCTLAKPIPHSLNSTKYEPPVKIWVRKSRTICMYSYHTYLVVPKTIQIFGSCANKRCDFVFNVFLVLPLLSLFRCAKALDRGSARLCCLAKDCDNPEYAQLVRALCDEGGVHLIMVRNAFHLSISLT